MPACDPEHRRHEQQDEPHLRALVHDRRTRDEHREAPEGEAERGCPHDEEERAVAPTQTTATCPAHEDHDEHADEQGGRDTERDQSRRELRRSSQRKITRAPAGEAREGATLDERREVGQASRQPRRRVEPAVGIDDRLDGSPGVGG